MRATRRECVSWGLRRGSVHHLCRREWRDVLDLRLCVELGSLRAWWSRI